MNLNANRNSTCASYEMPSQRSNGISVTFPWPNTQVLAEQLRNGDVSLNTAMSQFGAVMRETLKILEDFAADEAQSNFERKVKVDKMDKLICDLSEKCQAMQQALLYKEEKYDEKCREVERYKVICELSAKAAVNDDFRYGIDNEDENNSSRDPQQPQNVSFIKVENQCGSGADMRRSVKCHTKLSQADLHLSSALEALQSNSQSSRRSSKHGTSITSRLAPSYIGGPCKRKQTPKGGGPPAEDGKFREHLAMIGGVNVGPTTTSRPVPLDRLVRQPIDSYYDDDQNKRVKIALACQSNEVMSSSKNAVNQTKQKFTEKNLHRQVAGGCFTRLPSRRKKEWPF